MPAAPSRGYYSESIITTLRDDDGDMPAGGLPDVRQFPLRNPFLDDDYTADNNQLLNQESNEYQEALNADEQARFQRFEDARADLGFVMYVMDLGVVLCPFFLPFFLSFSCTECLVVSFLFEQ